MTAYILRINNLLNVSAINHAIRRPQSKPIQL